MKQKYKCQSSKCNHILYQDDKSERGRIIGRNCPECGWRMKVVIGVEQ